MGATTRASTSHRESRGRVSVAEVFDFTELDGIDSGPVLYRTRRPSAPLRPFVEKLWYHELPTSPHAMERLLPDGAIELIIDLTDTPKWWRDSVDSRERHAVRRAWISGQHSRHIVIEVGSPSIMIGVRYRPGGAFPFLGLPVSELNDAVEEMESLWGSGMMVLRERLLGTNSISERFRILEGALQERASAPLTPDPALRYAVGRLFAAPDGVSIRSLADEVGVTQKRLVRMFEKKVGLKPKTLARVARFQKVVRELERESRVSWSFIAHEAGYYDQAHFIRDFEALSGLKPSRYLVERGDYLNFVPIL